MAAVQVRPASVSMNGPVWPLSSWYCPVTTHEPACGHATAAAKVSVDVDEDASWAASGGSGTLAAVQAPPASVST